MKKIFIIGQMGSGKDTVKDLLTDILERRGINVAQGKLGKYIRSHVDETFYEGMKPTKREAYQTYAEGMKDLFGKDHWCRILEEEIENMDDELDAIIVADMRQSHEYLYFKDTNAIFVGVEAPQEARLNRIQTRDGEKQDTLAALSHVSEQEPATVIHTLKAMKPDNFFYVNNNKDLTALNQKVEALVEMFLEQGYFKGVII